MLEHDGRRLEVCDDVCRILHLRRKDRTQMETAGQRKSHPHETGWQRVRLMLLIKLAAVQNSICLQFLCVLAHLFDDLQRDLCIFVNTALR